MGLAISSAQYSLALTFILLIATSTISDCYDPLDPNGNITVTFDIHDWTSDGYVISIYTRKNLVTPSVRAYLAKVTIQNYYQYRHIDQPGWNIGWKWSNNEIIWSISGAFATVQGDCSSFIHKIPHSCQRNPIIADLMPDALPANKSDDCCHGGVLSAWAIDPSKSFSSFDITVGNLNVNSTVPSPANLTLLAPGPGYTCGPVLETDPTESSDLGGRRKVQVYKTWKSTCTYSSFLANKKPVCCVSMSTFYNPKITTCPQCSCGCKETNQKNVPCIREVSSLSSLSNLNSVDMMKCTDHMCPVKVHWHVKNNYMSHWKVKLTISNYNYNRNYSDWNVLVQHPGFSQNTTTYSFNSARLPTVGFADKVALFWGLQYYNTELLQANEEQLGSVTTEILLEKDLNTFSLSNGWALPRRIYFSGEVCEMPLPDTFPVLPNGSISTIKPPQFVFLLLQIYLTFKVLITGFWKITHPMCL